MGRVRGRRAGGPVRRPRRAGEERRRSPSRPTGRCGAAGRVEQLVVVGDGPLRGPCRRPTRTFCSAARRRACAGRALRLRRRVPLPERDRDVRERGPGGDGERAGGRRVRLRGGPARISGRAIPGRWSRTATGARSSPRRKRWRGIPSPSRGFAIERAGARVRCDWDTVVERFETTPRRVARSRGARAGHRRRGAVARRVARRARECRRRDDSVGEWRCGMVITEVRADGGRDAWVLPRIRAVRARERPTGSAPRGRRGHRSLAVRCGEEGDRRPCWTLRATAWSARRSRGASRAGSRRATTRTRRSIGADGAGRAVDRRAGEGLERLARHSPGAVPAVDRLGRVDPRELLRSPLHGREPRPARVRRGHARALQPGVGGDRVRRATPPGPRRPLDARRRRLLRGERRGLRALQGVDGPRPGAGPRPRAGAGAASSRSSRRTWRSSSASRGSTRCPST